MDGFRMALLVSGKVAIITGGGSGTVNSKRSWLTMMKLILEQASVSLLRVDCSLKTVLS